MSLVDRQIQSWLVANLARTRGNKLSRNIQRLLRGANTGMLAPGSGYGYPPEQYESRPGVPEDTGGVGVSILIESGLLAAVQGSSAVYASTGLVNYFSGPEDNWPWGGADHVQGVITGGTETCATGTAPTFSGAPSLSSENAYQSAATVAKQITWMDDRDRVPWRFTGLMRLAAQVIGPHGDIRGLRPSSWPAWNPVYYGLFRHTDYTYWLAYIGPDGVRVIHLDTGSTVECLRQYLISGISNTDLATRCEAAVLVTLSKPAGDDGVDILDADDMSAAHGDGFGPYANGWHFSPQAFGTASESSTDAVMLASKAESAGGFSLLTKHCTLSVDLGAGTAALVASASDAVSLGAGQYLWQESPTTGLFSFYPLTGRAPENPGDVYVIYRPSGPEWIRANATSTRDYGADREDNGSAWASASCGGGGSSASTQYWQGGATSKTVSFSLPKSTVTRVTSGTVWDRSITSTASGGGSETGYFTEGGGTGRPDGVTPGAVSRVKGVDISCGEGLNRKSDPPICSGASTITYGPIGAMSKIVKEKSIGGGFGVALIISADPTVLLTCTQKYFSGSSSVGGRITNTEYVAAGNYLIAVSVAGGEWDPGGGDCDGGGSFSFASGTRHDLPGGFFVGGNWGVAIYNLKNPDEQAQGESEARVRYSYRPIDSAYYEGQKIITETYFGGSILFCTPTLHSLMKQIPLAGYEGSSMDSSGNPVADISGWDDWGDFCLPGARGITAPVVGPEARDSYSGNVVYQPKRSKSKESQSGYDPAGLAASTVTGFIGFE